MEQFKKNNQTMLNVYYIICGMKYGSIRLTYNAYITYSNDLDAYMVYISRYDVCTKEDVCIGIFYCRRVMTEYTEDAYTEARRCMEHFSKVPIGINYMDVRPRFRVSLNG